MTFNGPIFICGTSRSGTSVLQSALEKNTRIAIAGETHYFDDLRVALGAARRAAPLDETMRLRVEDYFLALSHRPFGHAGDPNQGWMHRDVLRARAKSLGDGADAYFEAFCREWGARNDADIWGEKTPRHIFRLHEMLALYPEGKAIFMLRDPRAVVASYRDWKNQGGFDFEEDPGHRNTLAADEDRVRRSYHPVTIALLWVAATQAARQALHTFGPSRVRLQRYEELCDKPDQELGSIFDWLQLEHPRNMSAVPIRNSSYEKYSDTGGFVRGAIDRWQKTMNAAEIAVVERCCRSLLVPMGYEPVSPAASISAISLYYASAAPAIFRAAMINAKRTGNMVEYISRRARLVIGR